MTDAATQLSAVVERLRGSPLVVMLDVDGTLAPLASRPEEAAVPPETQRVVAALAARRDVRVALVSGRAAADALRMVGGTGLWAAGNHGFEFVSPQAGRQPHPAAAPFLPTIAATAAELRAALAGVEGVLVEDKALTISVHYRLVDPAAADEVRATAERIARAHGLRPSGGKLIVEIRPPVALDKGTAVIALAEELGGGSPDAAFFFAGDDVTDEDGFRRLRADHPHAVTVHVGPGHETAAEFTVPDLPAFRELLAALLASRGAPETTEGAPH